MPLDARFRDRLGTYLLGVAIGLTLLGFLFMARRQAAQQQPQGATPPSAAERPVPSPAP